MKKGMITMNYKYTYLSQIQLNKLLFHQTNTVNEGDRKIVCVRMNNSLN